VLPHQGREHAQQVSVEYAWCLYSGDEPDNKRYLDSSRQLKIAKRLR
jgi:hypothetical protein